VTAGPVKDGVNGDGAAPPERRPGMSDGAAPPERRPGMSDGTPPLERFLGRPARVLWAKAKPSVESAKRALAAGAARLPALGDRFPSLYKLAKRATEGSSSRVLVLISSMSVSYKIAATLITVLALAIASLGMVTFSRQKRILEQQMEKRAEVLVQHLANVGKEGLLTKQELPVFSAIRDFQSNLGAVYAMVVDGNGVVFAHSDLELKGRALSTPADASALSAAALFFQQTDHGGEPVLEAVLPVALKSGARIGTARVGLSKRELTEAIRRQKLVFFWISMLFVGIGLLISFGLAKVLTRPIYTLAVGMQEVAHGDLSRQVKVYYKDEIGKLTEVFNQMIMSLREKLHMEKYLSNSTIKSIRKHTTTDKLRLGGESKRVTALFSDVRGFTAMSEKMSPEEVVGLLNIYLNLQAKVVHQREGVVDKFVGDEVMAIFEGRDQEVNAVRAALEIQRYCQALNWARAQTREKQMQVGIGLNAGTVVMGNMGSEEQMNYTVIGDTINLAARLCNVAQIGQVVVSKAVADALGKEARLKKLDPVMVKGKEKPVDIYEVLDVNGASRKYMRRGLECEAVCRLSGLDESNPVVVKNVGPLGCLLESRLPLGVGAKLRLEADLKTFRLEQAATVRHVRKFEGKYYAGVHFDDMPDAVRAQVVSWIHRIETEISSAQPAAPVPAVN
jgi:adenylate cyclase